MPRGGEWGRSLGLSYPRDPRPSSCESLGRARKASVSRPAPALTTEPAHACWGWAGGCGQAASLRFGSSQRQSYPDRGAFQGRTEAPFTPAWPRRSVCRVSCAAGALPGALGVGGGSSLAMEEAGAGHCLLPCHGPLGPSLPIQSGTPCDRHPALAPGPLPQAAAGQTAAHEEWDGDGRVCPVPARRSQGGAGPKAGEERAHSELAERSGWGGRSGQPVLGRANPPAPGSWGRWKSLWRGAGPGAPCRVPLRCDWAHACRSLAGTSGSAWRCGGRWTPAWGKPTISAGWSTHRPG